MTQPGEDLHELDVPSGRAFDVPVADAYEQDVPANPATERPVPRVRFDADEADVLEQSQVVDLDDDYDR
ncbi:hypothetical protein Val02_76280 [Virgisporangium aliadipatigenens]|uniref:Uncharacterized protein n=1 Tax=Virgisporangium aliadipatigenens TaxID=741659 RepID=A0A8J4DW30_9ACTN|nr:hypothetical protein [Virgisporangium aliadipatigenens]GIJ50742.1 hypothetical protein Val02_76280 [Virgisporangium aliadipatigenens]